MKILRLKIFQESVCYKKPFSLKVSETYPLPPYSTVVGMMHKILGAKSGEFYPMQVSIQGDYDNIFNNYQTLRSYKAKTITTMPRNVNMLLNVNTVIHIKAQDEIIDRIYENITSGQVPLVMGRNEDIARIDEIAYVETEKECKNKRLTNNIYIPDSYEFEDLSGIHYILNTKYEVSKEGLRKWNRVNVTYAAKTQVLIGRVTCDEEDNVMIFCKVGD